MINTHRPMNNTSLPSHIGIVACSAEGAALCYKTICAEAPALLGPHAHPESSMHTPSLARYVQCLERGDLEGVGALLLASAQNLAAIGADFLICPDNTIHQAIPLIEARLPRPFLHIARVVAAHAQAAGYKKLALTGTRWLVEASVYRDALAAREIACIIPDKPARIEMNRIIMDELVAGNFTSGAVRTFQQLIGAMQDQGCDAVILGCTEIPLIISDENSPLPVLDSTRLLARAALQKAITGK